MSTANMINAAVVAAANVSLCAGARAALRGWYLLDNGALAAANAFCNAVAYGEAVCPAGVDATDAPRLAAALVAAEDEALYYTLLGAVGG
jgi:hypothetical protein